MLFYKIEGMLVNTGAENEDSRRAHREAARRIYMKSEAYNHKRGRDAYCFVSESSEGLLTAGAIIAQDSNSKSAADLICAYLLHIGCPLKDITVSEVTIGNLHQLLVRSDRNGYIEDAGEILEKFGIDRAIGHRGKGIEFGENIIEDRTRKEITEDTNRYLLKETLLPEFDRIYAGPATRKATGHPVHYMLRTDNTQVRREGAKLLLQALYANGRVRSKRYCFLDFRPGEEFSIMAYDSLYHVCAGGAVVVRYLAGDDSEDGGVASSERDTIELLCAVAKRHRNQVLTIFCLPRECKHAKAMFYENLGSMTMVEVCEDYSDRTRAMDFLKLLAKENHVRTDKALFAKLDPEKEYLTAELQSIFDAWYNAKLKTTIYPQYKDLQVVKQEAAKAAPRGSAYDELQEMIGLTEAKAVIRKALNYYKMQKLYEDKGIKPDTPAMHMVFTGNPGTAKTTVARLFARIMKDNGLLSKGQLVEVGRGDLVGKYVGWTAQTVQAKFRAAKGGVLFIDEAYSLVDGRSGSFGDEAINTIVQEMENHREDVVVIFAGYPKEMETFLQKNPGLRSRIAFHVPFADYDAEQLVNIARMMSKSKGLCFAEDALDKLTAAFEAARKQSDFGNGRYVRNLLEQAKMNQASRLLELDFDAITPEQVRTIQAEDIVIPEITTQVKRTIGFAC